MYYVRAEAGHVDFKRFIWNNVKIFLKSINWDTFLRLYINYVYDKIKKMDRYEKRDKFINHYLIHH